MKPFVLTLCLGLMALPAVAQGIPEPPPYEAPWNSTALHTPYRDVISEEERVAGLSLFWSEVKYNFAFFDAVPDLDWDSLYFAYLPEVRAAESTVAYYRLLQRMSAHLRDGHTGILLPQEMWPLASARPALRTRLVEDRVLLLEVLSEELRAQGLRPGVEVLAVDGIPVHDYARERVMPYLSTSTEQDLRARAYGHGLLAGPVVEPVALMLEDASGHRWTQTVPRLAGMPWDLAEDPYTFRLLEDGTAYFAAHTFMDPAVADSFAALLPQIQAAGALILDLRDNPGGNGSIGYRILAHLTGEDFAMSPFESPQYRPAYRAWGRPQEWFGEAYTYYIPEENPAPFTGPVAVLTSARTGSAAEDFSVAFDYMGRGTLVGEATAGSTGQPLLFRLPGGGHAIVCTKRDTYPDGRAIVGVGVLPQVAVVPTVSDVRAGRDPVLEAALATLRSELGVRSSEF